jgi:hypothetical protein
MEDQRRKERREKRVDPNPMGDISLLESPRKNVGTVARLGISEETARKRKKKKNKKENNDYDDESKKYSQEDGGDAFVAALATHAG